MRIRSFSALQRAENSSILMPMWVLREPQPFSALQRAENSSIAVNSLLSTDAASLSVLFSEPKIPQSFQERTPARVRRAFSALQRAENSSIRDRWIIRRDQSQFQCSSASRKFLNAISVRPHQRKMTFQCSSASRKFLNRSKCCDSADE